MYNRKSLMYAAGLRRSGAAHQHRRRWIRLREQEPHDAVGIEGERVGAQVARLELVPLVSRATRAQRRAEGGQWRPRRRREAGLRRPHARERRVHRSGCGTRGWCSSATGTSPVHGATTATPPASSTGATTDVPTRSSASTSADSSSQRRASACDSSGARQGVAVTPLPYGCRKAPGAVAPWANGRRACAACARLACPAGARRACPSCAQGSRRPTLFCHGATCAGAWHALRYSVCTRGGAAYICMHARVRASARATAWCEHRPRCESQLNESESNELNAGVERAEGIALIGDNICTIALIGDSSIILLQKTREFQFPFTEVSVL